MVLIRKRYFQQHLLARHRTNSILSIFAARAARLPRAASSIPFLASSTAAPNANSNTYPVTASNSPSSNTLAEHDTAARK